MRADANTLLERLGRQDFAYREFEDRFAELEPWPLFQALLKDRRLFTSSPLQPSTPLRATPAETPGETPGKVADSTQPATAPASLFRHYDTGTGDSADAPHQGQDIRGLLETLSRMNSAGEV